MTPQRLVLKVEQMMEADRRFWRPSEIAQSLKISWMEAALAMWACVGRGTVIKRKDGRFFYVDR
ncbi:MAG: hypothetical protein LAN84_09710 [Acidobacteriia bacterium]|nr:hypothetical protein [Terriglobia bacterium]